MRQPPPPPPPPPPGHDNEERAPPPAPPPPPPARRRNDGNNEERPILPKDPPPPTDQLHWTLRVRVPNSSQIRIIRVTDLDSVDTICRCLVQALGLNPTQVLAGLYVEQTGTFMSLPSILRSKEQRTIYSMEQKIPREVPWWKAYEEAVLYVLLPIVCAMLLLYHFETMLAVLAASLSGFDYMFIDQPLRNLYEHGPWLLGFWQGEPLAKICAHATSYGDAQFWQRNLPECTRLFEKKQDAFLHTARPVIYGSILVLVGWNILHRHPPPHPHEREMAELYRAVHVIVRQFHGPRRK